jgi:hypothetical protein
MRGKILYPSFAVAAGLTGLFVEVTGIAGGGLLILTGLIGMLIALTDTSSH